MITYESAESVSDGHPDKIADQISDAVVDAALTIDTAARVAVETTVKNKTITLSGEMSIIRKPLLIAAVKRALDNVGLSIKDHQVILNISKQSKALKNMPGANDQCTVVGYACNETPEYMPAPIMLAHKLMQAYKVCYTTHNGLLSDGKTQVVVEYSRGVPIKVKALTLSVQYDIAIPKSELEQVLINEVIYPVVGDLPQQLYINLFSHGGSDADCGVTGRKLMVDTYGPVVAHGGGAFSGKDPTKLDRSGAYMARYLAKQVVRSGKASKCQVTLVYTPGIDLPIHVDVETFSTGIISDAYIGKMLQNLYDLSPSGIISYLHLDRPIYFETASFGHFGRNFPWETR